MEEITQHVLMNTKTGDLFVGTKIALFEGPEFESRQERATYTVSIMGHFGWIIEHPELVVPRFFNRHCEKWFEVLSEL